MQRRRMPRDQFGDPLDEHPQLAADVAVRRERQVQRHRLQAPVLEQRQQLAAGEGMDREMVDHALETIDITASNARDMIKESRAGGAEGPVTGTVIG